MMSQAEIEHFLQAPRHAVVGTIGRDGAPQLSPVWFLYESGRFYIGITSDTAKHRNLRRDPRISLCIDGGREDVRTVIVYGVAELYTKADPLQVTMRQRLIAHYIPEPEAAQRYGEASQQWDSVLVVVTPKQLISQDFR
jgi:hypothetical protein